MTWWLGYSTPDNYSAHYYGVDRRHYSLLRWQDEYQHRPRRQNLHHLSSHLWAALAQAVGWSTYVGMVDFASNRWAINESVGAANLAWLSGGGVRGHLAARSVQAGSARLQSLFTVHGMEDGLLFQPERRLKWLSSRVVITSHQPLSHRVCRQFQ